MQTRRRGAPAPLRLLMERASEADVWKLALLQPGVLRLCLHQNRNVGVGVFPEGEKIPVRTLGLDLVPRESECSTQLQVCQNTNRIRADDPAMIEDLLKLGGRFRVPVRGQQRLAAHIGRVQTAKIK